MTSQHEFVELGPLDLAQVRWVQVRHVYVSPLPLDLSFRDAAEGLREELLSLVATTYPILAGTFHITSEGKQGVTFVPDSIAAAKERVRIDIDLGEEGTAVVTRERLLHGDISDFIERWASPYVEGALCVVKLSRCLVDGVTMIVVGLGLNHGVADATAAGRFALHWASRCQARFGGASAQEAKKPIVAPTFDRSGMINPLARPVAKPEEAAATTEQTSASPDFDPSVAPAVSAGTEAAPQSPPVEMWRLRFANSALDAARAEKEGPPLSRNDVVVATVLQAVAAALQRLDPNGDRPLSMVVPIDARGRGGDAVDIPISLFGNGAVLACATFGTISTLPRTSIADIAANVRQAIRAVAFDPAAIAKCVEELTGGKFSFPSGTSVALSSWVHAGLDEVTFFGPEAPCVWSGGVQLPPFPYLSWMCPSPPGVAVGIDVPLALPRPVMEALLENVGIIDTAHQAIFTVEGRIA